MPDNSNNNNVTEFPTNGSNRKRTKKVKLPDIPIKKITRHTPGTLAYAFHQQQMDNTTVFSFLQHLVDDDPRIPPMLADYEEQTNTEKENVVIWDKLCRKHKIPIGWLYGKLAETILLHSRNMGFTQLATDTPAVLKSLGKAAKKEKNLEHTRLFLETSGAIGGKSAAAAVNINVQQNIDNRSVQIGAGLPQIGVENAEIGKKIREANEKLLTEGKQDYIEAELVKKEEKELQHV